MISIFIFVFVIYKRQNNAFPSNQSKTVYWNLSSKILPFSSLIGGVGQTLSHPTEVL